MKVIKSFDRKIERKNFDCRIKALQGLLRHYDIESSLYMTMVLSESISFRYSTVDFEGFPVSHVPFAFATRSDVEKKIFDSLGLLYVMEEIDDSPSGWEKMKSLIDKETPILVKIDGNFVNRLSSSQKPNEQGMKVGHLSTLLLVGYSEEDKKYVALTEFLENDRIIPFALDRVQKARKSICFPYSPNFICLYLKEPPNSKKINNLMTEKGILSLKKISRSMIDPTSIKDDFVDDIAEEGFTCTNIRNGIPAMKALCRDLQELLVFYDHCGENADKILILLAQLLRSNLSLGGPSAFRFEFGECLKEMGKNLNKGELSIIGGEFTHLSFAWKKFIFQLRETAKKAHPREYLQKAIEIFTQIIENEEVLFSKLSNLLVKM